jgi:uncharacterized protein YciI
MHFFALTYDVVPNFAERRMQFREAHLRLIRDAHERGLLLFAGALGDPPNGALLVFRCDGPTAVEDFARADPYVREGLTTAWQVRPWNIVIGAELAAPPRAL